MLSLITWIPGLFLFAIQSSIAGWAWLWSNLWLAGAILLGMAIWIAVLSLIALALSAWIKWKIAAGALVLGVFFAGAGFGSAINSVLRTSLGSLIDLNQVVHAIWADLFRYDSGSDMPLSHAWIVLLVACLICLALLWKRVRAFEVVSERLPDHLRQRLPLLRRGPRRQSRHPQHQARHHQPRRPQWLR